MGSVSMLRQYKLAPTDRVLRSFWFDDGFLSCAMGPVGCGKTSCSLNKFARRATLQEPHPADGVRRTRWLTIRDTYRNLEKSTISSWKHWWPTNKRTWRGGGNGEPAFATQSWTLPDGTTVEMEVVFAAVGENNIEEFAGGFEITGFHIGEAADLPEEVYMKLLERAGRYPAVDAAAGFKGATWYGGWLDCNAPNFGSHIERNFVTEPKPGFTFHRMPGGLDADAENLQNLPGGRKYYERIAESSAPYYVRRFVHNQFGFDRFGKPVYEGYNPFKHLSKLPLKFLRGRKMYCGLDQGRQPAAVFLQRSERGQIRIYRELTAFNTGASEFGRMLRQILDEEFRDWEVDFIADPAGFNPSDLSEHDTDVWAMQVEAAADISIKPAMSSRRDAREKPLRDAMSRAVSAEDEGLIVDPSCRMIHEGLNQMFRFRKVSASGQPDRYAKDIEKNDHSHVVEAAEFAAMEAIGMGEILGRKPKGGVVDDPRDGNWRPAGF